MLLFIIWMAPWFCLSSCAPCYSLYGRWLFTCFWQIAGWKTFLQLSETQPTGWMGTFQTDFWMECGAFQFWCMDQILDRLLDGWVTFQTDFWCMGHILGRFFFYYYLCIWHFLDSLLDGLGKFKIEFWMEGTFWTDLWMDWAHSRPIYGRIGHIPVSMAHSISNRFFNAFLA